LRVEEEYVSNPEAFFGIALTGNTPVLSYGVGRQNLRPFPFTPDRLKELKENLFLDDYLRLVFAEERTELEGIIITSVHWIGEAQDEYDSDVAFLKFWTSIESIFSKGHGEDVTENLARNVSILLSFSDYRFVDVDERDRIYRALKNLYSTRSKLIHRGLRYSVKPQDLGDICKYASWSIASLFCLRSKGYMRLEQIEADINRLDKILSGEKGRRKLKVLFSEVYAHIARLCSRILKDRS
jgi:hypothetical protein